MAGLGRSRERHCLGFSDDVELGQRQAPEGATRNSRLCLPTQCSQQRDDNEMPPLRRFTPNLSFRLEKSPDQSGDGKVLTHSTTPPRRGTPPAGAVAAGTDKSRAGVSSVLTNTIHTTRLIGPADLVVHTAARRSSSSSPP
jgi:hypothetical protein